MNGEDHLTKKDNINLGCGSRYHPAWVNVDLNPAGSEVRRIDLSRKFPFEASSFSVVYHSNVLEHIRPKEAEYFMRECARICRLGGILRVAVPDLEQVCRLYLAKLEEAIEGKPGAREERAWMLLEMLDQMTRESSGGAMGEWLKRLPTSLENFVFSRIGNEGREFVRQFRVPSATQELPAPSWWRQVRQKITQSMSSPQKKMAETIGKFRLSGEVHHWMYDRFSLRELMENVGFSEIQVMQPGESRIPGWREFFLEVGPDGSVHKPDSLIVEGVRL